MKNLIIASTSTLLGESYLEYILPELKIHFKNCKTLLFIPFARPSGISHDDYTLKVAAVFDSINIKVQGLHEFDNKIEAIQTAEAIFTGGGNTFLLVSQLYNLNLMPVLSNVLKAGIPYLGTSAGSNIAGLTMQTTNDMPIVYPKGFETLGLIPFNLNPHFVDADASSKNMGETRETRISEFHCFSAIPVLGLREGSWLDVKGDSIFLKGNFKAKLFCQNQNAVELESGSDLSFIK